MSRRGGKPTSAGDDDGARTPLQAVVLADSFTQVCVQSFTRSVPLSAHGSLV